MDYFYKRYFICNKIEDKKYYLDLFLKHYFKKINYNDEEIIENISEDKKIIYNINFENIIFEFENIHLKNKLKIP